MFKYCLLISLAIAGVCAQEEAAPEPYSFAYDAGSHAAAESKDQSGKVTGYYTLSDADGRQRRVEYIADEGGFRAKVQTNEVGTKSENSADVEVLASPPTAEQLVATVETVPQAQRFVQTQQVVAAPQKVATTQYVQQPAYGYSGYSYYPGSYYGSNQQYAYGVAGSPAYGAYYGNGVNGVYGGYSTVASAAPATSYYKQTVNTVQPASYQVSRFATVPATTTSAVRYQTVGVPATTASAYRTSYQTVGVPASVVGYQTVGVPASSVGYQTVGVQSVPVSTATYRYKSVGVPVSGATTYQTSGVVPASVGSTANLLGSSNYIVLKKRETEQKA